MYHVYILQSQKDFQFYTGLTKDISRRLREHNSGQVKPTKGRRPLKMVYSEPAGTLAKARKREKFFKTGAGRELRESILKKHSAVAPARSIDRCCRECQVRGAKKYKHSAVAQW